jgi:L-iditol 2-dehydrogenase
MKAMVLTEYKHLEIQDVPQPKIADDELLVRVGACGICGSDVHGYDGSTGRRQPPVIMGHEAAGVVEQIGSAVSGFAEGDRVTFDSTVYCGKCGYCRSGRINLCDKRSVLGVSCDEFSRNGAYAEYVNVPQHIAYKLPDDLSVEHAAMVEPVSIAVHAVNRTPLTLNDTAVVVGSGMIGQLVVQVLKQSNCGSVIAIDIDDHKLNAAKQQGADATINSKGLEAAEVAAQVAELTGGAGADAAFEVVGATGPLQSAMACLRKGASLTLVGNISPTVELPLQAVVARELTFYGSCASNGEYPACIEMMARGDVDVKPMISAIAPLDDGPAWFERLYGHEPGLMKVILQP